jgi:hypothetical protein
VVEARNATPNPVTPEEIAQGWDVMINRSWLRCDDCGCWRNAPENVRDAVVAKGDTWTCDMATWRDVRSFTRTVTPL